jgi:hypothetical protein
MRDRRACSEHDIVRDGDAARAQVSLTGQFASLVSALVPLLGRWNW